MKNKKIIIPIIITLLLVITLGITYAFFTTTLNGSKNSVLVVGDIYMHFRESNQINITNARPMSKEEALEADDNVFNFTISGKNTSSEDIYYGISIVNGEGQEDQGKIRINPEHVNVYLKLLDELVYHT